MQNSAIQSGRSAWNSYVNSRPVFTNCVGTVSACRAGTPQTRPTLSGGSSRDGARYLLSHPFLFFCKAVQTVRTKTAESVIIFSLLVLTSFLILIFLKARGGLKKTRDHHHYHLADDGSIGYCANSGRSAPIVLRRWFCFTLNIDIEKVLPFCTNDPLVFAHPGSYCNGYKLLCVHTLYTLCNSQFYSGEGIYFYTLASEIDVILFRLCC